MGSMNPFTGAFADELAKVAGVSGLVEKLIGAKGSPLRKAVIRSATLGAGTTGLQTLLSTPEHHGKEGTLVEKAKPYLRNLAAGAAAGGLTGHAFPGWFSDVNKVAVH